MFSKNSNLQKRTPLPLWSTEAMTSHKTFFFHFSVLDTIVSVGHDEEHSQPKFGGNRFMVARDMAA